MTTVLRFGLWIFLLALPFHLVLYSDAAVTVTPGSTIHVNSNTSGDQEAPVIGIDSNGKLVVTWTDHGSKDVLARRFDAGGTPMGTDFVINAGTDGNQIASAVAVLPSGQFAVVWKDESGFDGDGYGVFVRAFSSSAVPAQSTDTNMSDEAIGNQESPWVSAAAVSGNYAAVWVDKVFGNQVSMRTFNGSGNPVSYEGTISNGSGYCANPQTAAGGNRIAVTWREGQGTEGDFVKAAIFDASNGGEIKSDFYVDDSSNRELGPAVAVDGSGKSVVAWTAGQNGAFFRVFDGSGNPLTQTRNANQTTGYAIGISAAAAQGQFVLAWRGPGKNIVARVFDFSGNALTDEFTVASSASDQFGPNVAVNSNFSAVFIAWQERNFDPDAGIAMRKFDVSGGGGGVVSVSCSGQPTNGVAPLTVNFTAQGAGGSGYTYAWTFGDGTSSNQQAPSHSYATAGSYTARVTLTATGGGTASCQQTITATSGPGLSATCSATPTSGIAPLPVNFTAQGAGGTGSYSYSWTFGDGGTAGQQSPSHSYAAAGNYTATVTVTSGTQNAQCSKTIVVSTSTGSVSVTGTNLDGFVNRGSLIHMRISGTGFMSGSQVSFGDPGVVVSNVNFRNPGSLGLDASVLGTAFLGQHDITVLNLDGSSGTGAWLFDVRSGGVYPAPTVASISPPAAQTSSTLDVTLTGSGFARISGLSIDVGPEVVINGVTWVASGRIVANITILSNALCGFRDVRAANLTAISSPLAAAFQIISPHIVIYSITPGALPRGAKSQVLQITGGNFTELTKVKIKGVKILSQMTLDCHSIALIVDVTATTTGAKRVIVSNSDVDTAKRKDIFEIL